MDLPSAMLAEIKRQLDIAQTTIVKLSHDNKRLRDALKDIAATGAVDASDCVDMARRALDEDFR